MAYVNLMSHWNMFPMFTVSNGNRDFGIWITRKKRFFYLPVISVSICRTEWHLRTENDDIWCVLWTLDAQSGQEVIAQCGTERRQCNQNRHSKIISLICSHLGLFFNVTFFDKIPLVSLLVIHCRTANKHLSSNAKILIRWKFFFV